MGVLAGADEAGLVGEDDKLRAITGAEFTHCTAHMCLGCGGTEDEPFGDFIVGETASHQRHHFTLALGQRSQVGCWLGFAPQPSKLGNQPPRHPWGEQPIAAGDSLNPADQVNRLAILDQKTAGASPQRLENVLV